MKQRLAVAVAVGALIAATAVTAHADAYDATLTRAIAAKERAMDVNEPARWEEALRLFQEADALRATREASYEIGHAAERLARTDLAVEAYEAALDLGLTGQPRAKAAAFISAHAAALGRVQLKGVSEGRVRSGGVDRGRLPLRRPLVLFPGDNVIEIIEPQGRATAHRVKVTAAHLEVLDLAASARPAPPVPPVASPAPPVASPTPASPPASSAPPDEPAPALGLAAPPAPHAPPPAPPPASPATRASPAAWWILGAGLALAAAGGVMVAVSQSRVDAERQDLRATCDVLDGTDACTNSRPGLEARAQSDVDAIATWKAVRIGSWIGVAAGAAAVGYGAWALVRGDRAEGGPTVAFTSQGLTLGWTGRF